MPSAGTMIIIGLILAVLAWIYIGWWAGIIVGFLFCGGLGWTLLFRLLNIGTTESVKEVRKIVLDEKRPASIVIFQWDSVDRKISWSYGSREARLALASSENARKKFKTEYNQFAKEKGIATIDNWSGIHFQWMSPSFIKENLGDLE